MKTTINCVLLLSSIFFTLKFKSQNIGINGSGATADPSALLDVNAVATPSLGVLIPRIALQAINVAAPVSSPATSLLVYNTASTSTGTNAVSAGYYYWDGAKWVRFAYSPSGTTAFDWNTLGNAGTIAGTNFLGTTDAQDLAFRTNNIEKMRILGGGNVGIGTSSPAEKLTIENGNIQLGELMPATGLGRKLYFSNTSNNTDDIYIQRENISLDNSNLQLMLGDNVGGDDNFLIKTTASTTPLLTVVNNGNIGINTAASPTEKLEVQGSVKIVDGTQGLNKVLTSDATGKATWKQPSGGYRQKYVLQGAQTYPNLTNTLMNFPTVTIPYTGFYLINFKSFFNVPNASEYSYYVNIYINGALYSTDETYTYCDANYYLNQTDVYTLQANAGDIITLYLNPTIGGVTINATATTYTRVRFDLLFLGN